MPEHGTPAALMRESHHIACLASYLERATSRRCMILLTCSDPSEASVAPSGEREYGHEGDSLALAIEVLSQGLSGQGRADRPTGWGASVYVQVMEPDAFGGASRFVRQTAFIAAACRSNPPAPGVEAVRLPGGQGLARRRQARATGLRLCPGNMEALMPWAERLRIAPPAPAH